MSAAGISQDASPQAQSVVGAARTFERDRYLSALLAPAEARDDLLAITGIDGEVIVFVLALMMIEVIRRRGFDRHRVAVRRAAANLFAECRITRDEERALLVVPVTDGIRAAVDRREYPRAA